jgi:hypothetical protein
MTKVVINTEYGGFGLSDIAVERYGELKGLGLHKVYVRNSTSTDMFHWQTANGVVFIPGLITDRQDPALIRVVEELGIDAVNSPYSSLEVVEIAEGTAYRIGEYDGLEWIEERDKIEWKIA